MYRSFQNKKYLFWAGTCCILQAWATGNRRLLAMAKSIFGQALESCSSVSEEARIYLYLLQQQEDHEEMLRFIENIAQDRNVSLFLLKSRSENCGI